MKDYSLMSDFDINHSVLSSMKYNGRVFDKPHFADGSSVGIHYEIGDSYEWFDYCNNPSDAWHIIKTNHINIGWASDEEWFARTVHTAKVFDVNPLRAAMIVYLMMRDEEE